MPQLFLNNAKLTLDGAHNDTTTTLTVNEGSVLPAISGTDYVYLTLAVGYGGTETAWEVVKVTGHVAASTTLTVQRGQDGTTGLSWSDNDVLEARANAATFLQLQQNTGIGKIIAAQQGLIGY